MQLWSNVVSFIYKQHKGNNNTLWQAEFQARVELKFTMMQWKQDETEANFLISNMQSNNMITIE